MCVCVCVCTILDKVSREFLIEKVTDDQRPEGKEKANHMNIEVQIIEE